MKVQAEYLQDGGVTESQNPSMAEVGRDLCGSPSPTTLTKQGHSEQAAQDCIQVGLEYLHSFLTVINSYQLWIQIFLLSLSTIADCAELDCQRWSFRRTNFNQWYGRTQSTKKLQANINVNASVFNKTATADAFLIGGRWKNARNKQRPPH